MTELVPVPPEVLMGEAGICGFWAMAAIAWVYQRNPRMNGWQKPSIKAILAAALWPVLPDPSHGARYVFSLRDLVRPGVGKIIRGRPVRAIYPCKVGELVFY